LNPVSQLGGLASWSGGTPTWVQVVWRMLTGLPFHLPLTLHQGSADPESGQGGFFKMKGDYNAECNGITKDSSNK